MLPRSMASESKDSVVTSTLATTLLCVSLSALLGYGVALLLNLSPRATRALLNFAVGLPLLITPFLSYSYARAREELIAAKAELHRLGISDELTGLYKRHYFFEFAQKELLSAVRYHYPVSLLVLDIDNFKRINNHYGYDVGDHTLRNVAKVIQESLRETDFLARYGGEEFAILMPHARWEDAEATAERVRTSLESLQTLSGGNQVFVTVSIGLASLSPEVNDLPRLIKKAEQALSYAKRTQGGNHVSVAEALPDVIL